MIDSNEASTTSAPPTQSWFGPENLYEGVGLFERTDPYTFDEQRAINQKGFLYPDYCVCRRPDLIQTPMVCRKQADLLRDPTLQMHYPNDSEQIKWVNETFVPYDLCYDQWKTWGVEYGDKTKVPFAEAGPEYARPEQTPEQKFEYFWQDKFTSNIKQKAYDNWKENKLAYWPDMKVNGYWETDGQCTCHKPNFLPPFIIFFF